MPKQSALADLLVKMSLDPALRRRFQEDPFGFLAEVELSDEELELIAGGNQDRIRDYLGGDAPVPCYMMFAGDDPSV